MADEIQITASLSYVSGKAREAVAQEILKITQTTQLVASGIWIVGTSEENMPVGDVTAPGVLYLKNLDADNFVKYGPNDGGSMTEFGRVLAGEYQYLRLAPSGVTLRAVADTAPVKVYYLLFNN